MMKSTLLQEYIAQQPALWRALLDSREEITAEFSRRFGGFQPDRVILVGSGSSHYAALMARPVLEHGEQRSPALSPPRQRMPALLQHTRCILPFRKAASAPIPMIWSVN